MCTRQALTSSSGRVDTAYSLIVILPFGVVPYGANLLACFDLVTFSGLSVIRASPIGPADMEGTTTQQELPRSFPIFLFPCAKPKSFSTTSCRQHSFWADSILLLFTTSTRARLSTPSLSPSCILHLYTMVDWSSDAEVLKDQRAFESLIYTLFGLYLWELLQTASVEWSLITRRRKFRWPMVPFYFLCRYCMLLALIGLIISFNVTQEINCGALYTFNSWTGNMAILCASTSLMIRTIAIWERKLTVVIPLLVLCLAHWGLLYHGIIIVRATWDPQLSSCTVNQTNPAILKFTFFATMGFDLIIFVITSTALLRNSTRSGLWQLLFRDGLIYWAVTFSVNCIPAVLNSLDLNTPMNIIAAVPAATVASIAACRCVIRLQEYGNHDGYVNNGSAFASVDGRVRFSSTAHVGITSFGGKSARIQRPEVHIRTDQITMENLGSVEYEDLNVGSAITTDSLKTPRDLEAGPVGNFKYDDKESRFLNNRS